MLLPSHSPQPTLAVRCALLLQSTLRFAINTCTATHMQLCTQHCEECVCACLRCGQAGDACCTPLLQQRVWLFAEKKSNFHDTQVYRKLLCSQVVDITCLTKLPVVGDECVA